MEKLDAITFKNRPYHYDCVQWNEDGQVAVCLDAHVHIITPMIVSLNSKEDGYKHVGFSLPKLTQNLPATAIENTDDVQISFLNEEGYRCANWSQTGLSASQSCILAVVTTKHRVCLYQSSAKDPLNSDWQLYLDLTDQIKEFAIMHDHPTKINPHHTLYAQWSKKIVPNPLASKPCLLALTNKAGDICIWNVTSTAVNYCRTITAHTSFVNLVEWSNWKKGSQPNTYIAFLVSSSTNGTVSLSSVQVTTSIDDKMNTIIEDMQTSVVKQWFNEESAVTTLIKLQDNFETKASHLRIALCKGIQILFISLNINGDTVGLEKEWQSYCLQNSGLGLSGGSWINEFDFRCYTVEGEGLQLRLDPQDQLIFNEREHLRISGQLVQKYRYQWMEEQAKTEEDDVVGASDARPFVFGAGDGLNHIYTAIFFTMRPSVDVHYRPESLEEANLIFILQEPRGLLVNSLVEDIDTYVNNPNFFFVKPVRGLIREILDYLIEDDNAKPIEKWFHKLTDCMAPGPTLDDRDLGNAIYSEPSTIASRIILNAEMEMKNYRLIAFDSELKAICAAAREKTVIHFLSYVFHFTLHLPDEQFNQFSSHDQMVLLLLSDYALLIGNSELRGYCMDAYMKLQERFKDLNLYQEIAYVSKPEGPFTPVSREKCPVCDELVQAIGDSNLAQCGAGHFWELCSITRRVLYSPEARKCINCGAKSLKPSDEHSLTNTILNHCSRCIYCGGGLLIT